MILTAGARDLHTVKDDADPKLEHAPVTDAALDLSAK